MRLTFDHYTIHTHTHTHTKEKREQEKRQHEHTHTPSNTHTCVYTHMHACIIMKGWWLHKLPWQHHALIQRRGSQAIQSRPHWIVVECNTHKHYPLKVLKSGGWGKTGVIGLEAYVILHVLHVSCKTILGFPNNFCLQGKLPLIFLVNASVKVYSR